MIGGQQARPEAMTSRAVAARSRNGSRTLGGKGPGAMTDATGLMICGHGSRSISAIAEFNLLAEHLRSRMPQFEVESGFLEFARPVIRTGLEALKARGVGRIVCLPGMLFAAGHVKNDLPSEINAFAAENPGIRVSFGRELAVDSRLLRAAAARIAAAEAAAATTVDRKETLLMVVGRGTNDPDANSNVSKVARMLWEGMRFGWTPIRGWPTLSSMPGSDTPSSSATAGLSFFRTSCSPASSSSGSMLTPMNARRRIPRSRSSRRNT